MTDTAAPKTTVSITVDGRAVEAKPGELLINACEQSGSFPTSAITPACRQWACVASASLK